MRACKNCLDVIEGLPGEDLLGTSFNDNVGVGVGNGGMGSPGLVAVDNRNDNLSNIEVTFNQRPKPTPMMAIPATKKGEQVEISPGLSEMPGSPRSFNSRSGRFRSRAATFDGSQRAAISVFNNGGGNNIGMSPLSRSGSGILDQLPHPIDSSPPIDDCFSSDTDSSDEGGTAKNSGLNSSKSDGDLTKNKINRRTSFRRPTSSTGNRSSDQMMNGGPKSSLMRIGQRRRSFPTMQLGFAKHPSMSFLRSFNNDSSYNYEMGNEFALSNDRINDILIPNSRTFRSPSIDLNKASINHAHIFLDQLLEYFSLPKHWHDILMKPLLLCAENIDLDVKGGDSIDIRHYVKIKRIPGGSLKNTTYVDGTVFCKSLALKSMPNKINDPRILLITFPIEYSRNDQHFMSLDPILAQESEYIKKLVKRIVSLNPQVLISANRISGLAIDLLAREGVAVISNTKLTAMSRIARYTQADILTSIDKLAMNPRLGQCSMFEVKTFRYQNLAKTFVYISGISRELGCTIVLRGCDKETLGSVKAVVEFLVYVVFNLKLETSLMRDQFIFIPSDAVSLEQNDVHKHHTDESGYFHDLIRSQAGKVISSSPFVQFGNPYLLLEARGLEDQLVAMGRENEELGEGGNGEGEGEAEGGEEEAKEESGEDKIKVNDKEKGDDIEVIKKSLQKINLGHVSFVDLPGGLVKAKEIVQVVNDERFGTLRDLWASQKRQWELSYSQSPGMFDPFHRQCISVLFSVVCTATRMPCVGPEQTEIDFYSDSDTTLGQFVENMCTADEGCPDGCDYSLRDHYRSYVNGTGRITVRVEKFQCKLPGLQNTILMWSYCKECENTMPVLPMSGATWKYSFGKYLELSFYSTKLSFRAGQCVHNIYRDHIRYFGFHDLAVRFEYDSINLLEIIPPQWKVQWKPEISARYKIDVFRSITTKGNRFWDSVLSRLNRVVIDELAVDKTEECQARIELLKKRVADERTATLYNLSQIYVNTDVTVILPMNGIIRDIQELVVKWDSEFVDFENNFFPSEKDITRITSQHLKKIFLSDESVEQSDRGDTGTDVAPTPIGEKELLMKEKIEEVINEKVELEKEEAKDNLVPVLTTIPSLQPDNTSIQPEPVKQDHKQIAIVPTMDTSPDPKDKETILEALKLADAYKSQSELDKAIAMYNLYLDGHRKLVPHDFDKNFLHATQNLATSYQTQGRLGLAEKTYQNLLQCKEIIFGDAHIDTIKTIYDLGLLYQVQGRLRIATVMFHRALEGRMKLLGPKNKDTLGVAHDLAVLYRTQGMIKEADEMYNLLEEGKISLPSYNEDGDGGIEDTDDSSIASLPASFSKLKADLPSSPEKKIPLPSPIARRPNTIVSPRGISPTRPISPRKETRVMEQVLKVEASLGKEKNIEAIRSSITSPRQEDLFRRPVIPGKGSSIPTLIEGIPSSMTLSQSSSLRNEKRPKFRCDEGSNSGSTFTGTSSRKKFIPPSRFATRELENQLLAGRMVNGKSKVSSLAKHFDQLSMEFEKERARERKLLAQGRFRAFPVAKSKPIVEVFKNVEEAVEEVSDDEHEEDSEDDIVDDRNSAIEDDDAIVIGEGSSTSNKQPSMPSSPKAGSVKDNHDDRQNQELNEHLVINNDDVQDIGSSRETLDSEYHAETELPPTAEKQSLMQSLANFWADRSATGWNALEYPLRNSEHIFADSDVIVREDEPSSLIAFCLSSPDYLERMANKGAPPPIEDSGDEGKHVNFEKPPTEELERWMLKKTGIHLKYQFQEGSARLSCKIFYSQQFAAFRKKCCGSDKDYIQSLARCIKWDSSGGKSGSAFLKTLDDRLVVKQLSPTELDAFVKFAPSYFKYMAQALFHDLPTVLAKIFGFYQIQIRNPITGKTLKMDVVVMENLFYQRKMSRIFDLKGSMRNRHVQQTGRENEVLLDENMVEYIYESPLFVREHSKRLLKNSLFNDTLFLEKMNVMDYSLVIGIDEEHNEIVVGIIGK